MPCSDRKRLANQINALKSTGPRTEEGKAASRRNALQHGLAAAVLLPTEDEGELARRVAYFQDSLAEDGDGMALLMAERIGYLSLRLKRCFERESAVGAFQAREAADAHDEERRATADHILDYIANAPATGRRRLLAMPEGVDLLLQKLADLRAVAVDGLWTQYDGYKLDHYTGRRPSEAPASRCNALSDLLARGDAAGLRADEVAAVPPDRRREWAHAEIIKLIDAEVARLHAHRPTLDHERFARNRAEACRRAAPGSDKTQALAHRYEAAADLALDRAFRQLDAYRRDRRRAALEERAAYAAETSNRYADEPLEHLAAPALAPAAPPAGLDPPAPAPPAPVAAGLASFGEGEAPPRRPADASEFAIGKPPAPPAADPGTAPKPPRYTP